MPQLVNGEWVKGDIAASEIKVGAFQREPTRFRSWITPMASRTPSRIRFFVLLCAPAGIEWLGMKHTELPRQAIAACRSHICE